MQRLGILFLFLFGIPGMVDDYRTWTTWLALDLPPGLGTAMVLTAAAWAVLFTYYRSGENWAIIHLPWVGRSWALRRFRELEHTLDSFGSQSGGIEYARINELALRLKEIGIEYPMAGIDWRLRKQVTADLLAACRAADLEHARSAWQRAQEKWAETSFG